MTGTLGEEQCDKGKEILVQAWTGLEGFRRMRFPGYKTIGK